MTLTTSMGSLHATWLVWLKAGYLLKVRIGVWSRITTMYDRKTWP